MRDVNLALLAFVCVVAAMIAFFVMRNDQGANDEPVNGPNVAAPAAVDTEKNTDSTSQGSLHTVDAHSATTAHDVEDPAHVKAPLIPLQFPTWPAPKLALVITGEQLGYFEPCGCTANQLGGMSRRASLFDQMRSLGWEVRGVDAGSVLRRTGTQAKFKFETTLEALRELRYIALGLGPEELKLEPGYLLSQHLTEGDEPLKFLSANVTFYGSRDFGTPASSTVVEINGIKVGITSVMSNTIRKTVIPDMTPEQAENAEMQWSDPGAALQSALKEFDDAGATVKILLAQSTLEESKKMAEDFPGFTFVVQANGFGEGKDQPVKVGDTWMLEVGKKGKTAGVIGLYPDDSENPVRFELVTLNGEQFADSDRMTQLMQNYQDRLKSEAVVKSDGVEPHPSGATFVGATKCGECHTKAHAIWQETPHAHAFESLDPTNKRKGFERLRGVARTFDPECIACHVTGWEPEHYFRFESGFINEEFAEDDSEKRLQGLLAGNQCENCHGPGSKHVEYIEAENVEAAIKEVKVTLGQVESTCNKCHDGDNSPGFKFEKYWDDVKHYGKE